VQVKLSANKLQNRVAKNRLTYIRIGLFIAVPLFVVLGLFDTYVNYVYHEYRLCWNLSLDECPSTSRHMYEITTRIKPAVLRTISTALIVASCCLIWNIHSYFEKEMKKEACRITTVTIIFPISYLVRAGSYLLMPTGELSGGIPETPLFKCNYALYLVYDILPLSYVMFNHYQSFTNEERVLKDREETAAA